MTVTQLFRPGSFTGLRVGLTRSKPGRIYANQSQPCPALGLHLERTDLHGAISTSPLRRGVARALPLFTLVGHSLSSLAITVTSVLIHGQVKSQLPGKRFAGGPDPAMFALGPIWPAFNQRPPIGDGQPAICRCPGQARIQVFGGTRDAYPSTPASSAAPTLNSSGKVTEPTDFGPIASRHLPSDQRIFRSSRQNDQSESALSSSKQLMVPIPENPESGAPPQMGSRISRASSIRAVGAIHWRYLK